MPFVISLIVAAALAFINLWLAARIVPLRVKGTAIGSGGDPRLEARMRAQSNFAEYVPIALILIALIEAQSGASVGLWVAGVALIIGRVLHPFGLDRPSPNPLRAAGILLTWVPTLALAIWALVLAFSTAPERVAEPTYFGVRSGAARDIG